MPTSSLTLLLLSASIALCGAEPAPLYIPGAGALDANDRALLRQGDQLLIQSYHAIHDAHDPAAAEAAMQKVISIQALLTATAGADGPESFKVGVYGRATKYLDIVDHGGALDGFAEMELRSLATVLDSDYKIHKRKTLAEVRSKAKDLKTLQRFIVDELYDHGNIHGASANASAPPEKAPVGQKPGAPLQVADRPQAMGAPPTGVPPAGTTAANPPDPLPAGAAGAPQATAAATPPLAAAAAPAQAQSQAPVPGTDASRQAANPLAGQNPDPTAAAATALPPASGTMPLEALAQKQDLVAAMLDHLATQSLGPGAKADDQAIAQAFRRAAEAARVAATMIRHGDHQAAMAAATTAQQALDQAFAAAQGTGQQLQQEQTAALANAAAAIQERQVRVVTDAQHLAAALAAGTMSPDDGRLAGHQLAQRQAALKGAIDDLQHQIGEAAATAPGMEQPGATPAVQEGLASAATAIHEGRAPQDAVNATINLEQGHQAAAMAAIARELAVLHQVQARLSAAADAAADGHGSDRQVLAQLQQLSSAYRQLGHEAEAAIAGAKADAQASPSAGAGAPLPADLGKVLDANAATLAGELERALAQVAVATPAQRADLLTLSRTRAALSSDPDAGLRHLDAVASGIEGLEAALNQRIAQDQQSAALESFHQDSVPAAYRSSVADYYQLLAGDGVAAAPTSTAATTPAQVTP